MSDEMARFIEAFHEALMDEYREVDGTMLPDEAIRRVASALRSAQWKLEAPETGSKTP